MISLKIKKPWKGAGDALTALAEGPVLGASLNQLLLRLDGCRRTADMIIDSIK